MILRGTLLLLSAACLTWAVIAGPPAAGANAISQLGKRIATGETFRPEILQRMLETQPQTVAGNGCYVPDVRGRSLIATRLAELALEAGQTQILNARLASARDKLRQLLACEPHDSFSWLALYWTSGHLEGFGQGIFGFLDMSYRTGPLEGWIAFRRNPLAALVFRDMSPATQAHIIDEWRGLVAAALYEPAALAMERLSPSDRDVFLGQQRRIPPSAWSGFVQFLERRGSPVVLTGAP